MSKIGEMQQERAVVMMEGLKCAVLADMFAPENAARQKILAKIIREVADNTEQKAWTVGKMADIGEKLKALFRAMGNMVEA